MRAAAIASHDRVPLSMPEAPATFRIKLAHSTVRRPSLRFIVGVASAGDIELDTEVRAVEFDATCIARIRALRQQREAMDLTEVRWPAQVGTLCALDDPSRQEDLQCPEFCLREDGLRIVGGLKHTGLEMTSRSIPIDALIQWMDNGALERAVLGYHGPLSLLEDIGLLDETLRPSAHVVLRDMSEGLDVPAEDYDQALAVRAPERERLSPG